MNVEIKNQNYTPIEVVELFNFLENIEEGTLWDYHGLSVEIDPIFDFKGDNVLVRWVDVIEGFNDKIIVSSIDEFNQNFQLFNNA